ncbi:MAG: CHAT domain-containing protein, partial [Bacteroidota bacterium]
SEVQSDFIEQDESLIEYFVGGSNIYVAIISSSSIEVKKLGASSKLASLVTKFRAGISQYHLSNSANQSTDFYNETLDQYATSAKELYDLLIVPLQLKEKLIIIPDGLLGCLPFDALLTESLSDYKTPYKRYPFLIKEHQISYLNSVNVQYYNDTRKNTNNNKILAFAPSFSSPVTYNDKGIRGGLGQLKYNVPESKIAVNIIGGKLFEAQEAVKANFLKYAPDYSILHLSTHGKANDQVGDASFLAFTEIPDSTDANERLFVRELYNLDLKAELVVLSACETGIGELQQGEGIVSLARGFAYAGVKSLITTLWSVDDEQTQNIITKFYKNIKKRQSKDLALRQAKLDYIQESPNIKAHPFYWAAYTPIGDMNPIRTRNSKLLWMVGLIPILGALFFLFQKNRKTSLQN